MKARLVLVAAVALLLSAPGAVHAMEPPSAPHWAGRAAISGKYVNLAQFHDRPVVASFSVQVASTAPARTDAGKSASSETLDPLALAHAQTIRREITARYAQGNGPRLVVTEASSTAVVESFTLFNARLDETKVVAADNGIYFGICPRGARCPYPARRSARPAADFLPRRQALELALRTFLETSADVVAVSLPTPRFILFVVERDELAREVDIPAAAEALNGDPSHALAAWLQRLVDRVTRPRIFVFLLLEPTASGRDTVVAIPRWPTVSARDEGGSALDASHGEFARLSQTTCITDPCRRPAARAEVTVLQSTSTSL